MKKQNLLGLTATVCLVLLILSVLFAVGAHPAAAKTWKLKYQSMTVRGSDDTCWAIDMKIKELIEQRTKGRVKVEVYGTPEIVGWREMVPACEEGTIDMFQLMDGPLSGPFPFIKWNATPLRAEWPDGIFDFWNKSGVKDVIEREVGKRNLKILSFFEWGDGQVILRRDKFVKSLEDFKGFKVRVPPGTWVSIFKSLGATPTAMPSTELYSALQRGVVDGCATGLDVGTMGWKTYEVAPYATFAGGYWPPGGSRFVFINKKRFESMPKDIQEAIMKSGHDVIHPFAVNRINERSEFVLSELKRLTGNTPYRVPDAQVKKWSEMSKAPPMKYYRKTGGAVAAEIIALWEKYYGKKAP